MSAYALPNLFPSTTSVSRTEAYEEVDSSETKHCDVSSARPGENKAQKELAALKQRESNFDVTVNKANLDVCRLVSSAQHDPPTARRSSAQDVPVTFELSITVNGRKYSAQRTLPRFVQLRKELITECTRSGLHDVVIPELPTLCDDGRRNVEAKGSVDISLSKDSFTGKGFAMLHNLCRSYVPMIERWLYAVSEIVPSSPSLTRFLWEPIDGTNGGERHNSRLESIDEDDDEFEYAEVESDVLNSATYSGTKDRVSSWSRGISHEKFERRGQSAVCKTGGTRDSTFDPGEFVTCRLVGDSV